MDGKLESVWKKDVVVLFGYYSDIWLNRLRFRDQIWNRQLAVLHKDYILYIDYQLDAPIIIYS